MDYRNVADRLTAQNIVLREYDSTDPSQNPNNYPIASREGLTMGILEDGGVPEYIDIKHLPDDGAYPDWMDKGIIRELLYQLRSNENVLSDEYVNQLIQTYRSTKPEILRGIEWIRTNYKISLPMPRENRVTFLDKKRQKANSAPGVVKMRMDLKSLSNISGIHWGNIIQEIRDATSSDKLLYDEFFTRITIDDLKAELTLLSVDELSEKLVEEFLKNPTLVSMRIDKKGISEIISTYTKEKKIDIILKLNEKQAEINNKKNKKAEYIDASNVIMEEIIRTEGVPKKLSDIISRQVDKDFKAELLAEWYHRKHTCTAKKLGIHELGRILWDYIILRKDRTFRGRRSDNNLEELKEWLLDYAEDLQQEAAEIAPQPGEFTEVPALDLGHYTREQVEARRITDQKSIEPFTRRAMGAPPSKAAVRATADRLRDLSSFLTEDDVLELQNKYSLFGFPESRIMKSVLPEGLQADENSDFVSSGDADGTLGVWNKEQEAASSSPGNEGLHRQFTGMFPLRENDHFRPNTRDEVRAFEDEDFVTWQSRFMEEYKIKIPLFIDKLTRDIEDIDESMMYFQRRDEIPSFLINAINAEATKEYLHKIAKTLDEDDSISDIETYSGDELPLLVWDLGLTNVKRMLVEKIEKNNNSMEMINLFSKSPDEYAEMMRASTKMPKTNQLAPFVFKGTKGDDLYVTHAQRTDKIEGHPLTWALDKISYDSLSPEEKKIVKDYFKSKTQEAAKVEYEKQVKVYESSIDKEYILEELYNNFRLDIAGRKALMMANERYGEVPVNMYVDDPNDPRIEGAIKVGISSIFDTIFDELKLRDAGRENNWSTPTTHQERWLRDSIFAFTNPASEPLDIVGQYDENVLQHSNFSDILGKDNYYFPYQEREAMVHNRFSGVDRLRRQGLFKKIQGSRDGELAHYGPGLAETKINPRYKDYFELQAQAEPISKDSRLEKLSAGKVDLRHETEEASKAHLWSNDPRSGTYWNPYASNGNAVVSRENQSRTEAEMCAIRGECQGPSSIRHFREEDNLRLTTSMNTEPDTLDTDHQRRAAPLRAVAVNTTIDHRPTHEAAVKPNTQRQAGGGRGQLRPPKRHFSVRRPR